MRLSRLLLVSAFVVLLPAGTAWAQDAPAIAAPGIAAEDQIVLAGSVTVPRGQRVGEVVVFSGRVTVNGVATNPTGAAIPVQFIPATVVVR